MKARTPEKSTIRVRDQGKPYLVQERNIILIPDDAKFHPILDDDAKLVVIKGVPFYSAPNNPRYSVLLAGMGYNDIKSPIFFDDYDWSNVKPFDAQIEMAGLMVARSRAYNTSDMGAGKTRGTLLAIDWLMKEDYVARVLVVAPLSILKNVWAKEIMHNTPRIKPVVLYGSKAKREKLFKQDYWNLAIINHDGVYTIQEYLLEAGFQMVVVDELSAYRDYKARRFRALRPIIAKASFACGLTGTPTPTGPWDVYGQVKLLQPEKIKMSYTSFKQTMGDEVAPYVWKPKPKSHENAVKLMQPAIRFKRSDIVELKAFHHHTLDVELSKEQVEIIKELKDEAIAIRQEGVVTAVNAAVMVNKLLQASAGAVYTTDKNIIDLKPKHRLETAGELVAQAEGKVLLFAPYRHLLEMIYSYMKPQVECALVHGGVKDRDRIFADFQIDGFPLRLIVAHPQCMAHGLNLHVANTVIWFGPTHKLEIYNQANARVMRPGQTREQFIYHLQGNTYERKVYQALEHGLSMEKLVLDLFEELAVGMGS